MIFCIMYHKSFGVLLTLIFGLAYRLPSVFDRILSVIVFTLVIELCSVCVWSLLLMSECDILQQLWM